MKTLDNIINIRKNHPEIYEMLLTKPCKILLEGKIIHEGTYDKNIGIKLENPNQALTIFEFDENTDCVFTISENKYVNDFINLFEGLSFEEVMSNSKSYNKAMNLAMKLPKFPITEVSKKGDLYSQLESLYELLKDEKEIHEADEEKSEEDKSIPGDGLPNKDEKEKKKELEEKSKIKFTIWTAPDKKADWLDSNTAYQKIEYIYDDKKNGCKIHFLLGYKDGTWKLWVGKLGAVSYDDKYYYDTKEHTFAKGILSALDKVIDMTTDIKENPDNWPQFYINI